MHCKYIPFSLLIQLLNDNHEDPTKSRMHWCEDPTQNQPSSWIARSLNLLVT